MFRGREGRAYSHQAQITSLDERLYLSWSLGVHGEEEPAQTVVFATSDDLGATWSEPAPIVGVQPGAYAARVACSSGIRVYDGLLVAYVAEWEYDEPALDKSGRLRIGNHEHHLGTRTRAAVSTDSGESWSDPVDVMPRIASYHPPSPTTSGRLILPGHVTFPYTDDPAGLSGWTFAGLSGLPPDFVDDTMGWDYGREARKDARVFNEGSFFQTDDGVIHMMLRSESDRLWVTESRDDGETWSEPVVTDHTDGICRPHFGPAGRRPVLRPRHARPLEPVGPHAGRLGPGRGRRRLRQALHQWATSRSVRRGCRGAASGDATAIRTSTSWAARRSWPTP